MANQKLRKQIAKLEFINDQLSTELADLDLLLQRSGFPNGLTSLKLVALEMLAEQNQNEPKLTEE